MIKQLSKAIVYVLFNCCIITEVNAQETRDTITINSISTDTINIKQKKGSIFSGKPGKAMIMSLIIPGTGQIYNKSYLRVPFVWGAVGGMGWLVYDNTQKYNCLSDAYKASIDMEPYTFPDHCSEFSTIPVNSSSSARLKSLRDEYNNNRQLSIVGLSLVWLANGIDAFVNAHLKEFDVDENLSIDFGSRFDNDPNSPMRMGIFVQF